MTPICECGHPKVDHRLEGLGTGPKWCACCRVATFSPAQAPALAGEECKRCGGKGDVLRTGAPLDTVFVDDWIDCPACEGTGEAKPNAEGTAPESFYMRDLTPAEQAQHREAIKAQMVAPEPLLSDAEIDQWEVLALDSNLPPALMAQFKSLCAQAKLANRPASEAQGMREALGKGVRIGFAYFAGLEPAQMVSLTKTDGTEVPIEEAVEDAIAALTAPDRTPPSREGWLTRDTLDLSLQRMVDEGSYTMNREARQRLKDSIFAETK